MYTWFYWSNMPCQKELRFENPTGAAGKSEGLTVSVFASALQLTALFQKKIRLCLYSHITRLPRSSIRGKLGAATQERKKERLFISNEVTRRVEQPPDPMYNFCSFPGKQISEKYFSYRSVQILKILFRRFYSPESDPPYKIMWYWFYYSIQLDLLFAPDHHGRVEMLCTTVVPAPKGHLGGASP